MRSVNQLQKYVLNPLDKLAFRLGVPPAGDALLETIGRRSGDPRVTPVCDCLVGDTFWIIAQRGRDSGYVKSIEGNPNVRVEVNGSGAPERRTSSTTTIPANASESSDEAISPADSAFVPRTG